VTRRERLEETYRLHHRANRARDFVFGGSDRAELFRHYVGGPGRRVLDLGCRYGALARTYAAGNDVVGVDVDREALAEAAKLGIETVWADVEEPLPFEEASFDVVVAGELVEHLRDPAALVGQARRLLRPGGRLVASVPNFYRLKNRLRFLFGRPLGQDPTHLHVFAPRDVAALLDGWEDVHVHFASSRLLRLSPRLFGNTMIFTGRKPAADQPR
jgi:SAM-dependent methyltransferase